MASAAAVLLLVVWTGLSHGSPVRPGLLVRPFQGEGLDADKSWMPGAVTFLLQSGLGNIQGVEVVAIDQESLRRSDYVITGSLRVVSSDVVCVARISRADGTPPLREVTVSEKGTKPDLFVVAAKVYASLKDEVAKAGTVASWPGSLNFPTLSLYALRYFVEAGMPGAEHKRLMLYQRALSLDPALVEAWLGLGEERLFRGNVFEAGVSVRKALRLKPDHPEGNNLLGRVHLGGGGRAAAEACFRKAVLADPLLLDAWRNLGRLLRAGGREQEAQAVYLTARNAFGVDAGVMPEAAFFAAAVDGGSAASGRSPQQVKQTAPRGSAATASSTGAQTQTAGSTKSGNGSKPKPAETEEPGSQVANLERKLAERQRQVEMLQAQAAKVDDLEGRLAKASESGVEAGRLRKELTRANEELEALRGASARLKQAQEKGAVDRQRVEALEVQLTESVDAREEVRRLKKDLEQKGEELRSLQRDLEGLKDRERQLERLREEAAKTEPSGAQPGIVTQLGRKIAQLTEELRRKSSEVEKLQTAMSGRAEAEKIPGSPVGGGTPR